MKKTQIFLLLFLVFSFAEVFAISYVPDYKLDTSSVEPFPTFIGRDSIYDSCYIADSHPTFIELDSIYDSYYIDDSLVYSHSYRHIEELKPIRASNSLKEIFFPLKLNIESTIGKGQYAFYDEEKAKWISKDTTYHLKLIDTKTQSVGDYDSTNSKFLLYSSLNFEDTSIVLNNLSLAVNNEFRFTTYMALFYIQDTVVIKTENSTETSISTSSISQIHLDSAALVTGLEESLAKSFDLSNKKIYKQIVKLVIAQSSLIDKTPTRIKEFNKAPNLNIVVQRIGSGFLIRGAKGEIPSVKNLKGKEVFAREPVSPGIYFVSLKPGLWHRVSIHD
ncbi:MAG: hypothetical protein GX116_03810 [Fibrobacter sp.]|nr:hypothetical protein [Fibrobacter sp.]